MAKMTLGSLFDGIGGWQLAAIHNGVEPIWSSEIEAFPCAVTKKHFPKTLQLGDITKLDGAKLPPVDIICAGSPCQDLSVAGKQEGLKGARSGLFMDAVKLVRRMRTATSGQYPRYFVWENVPGAFSSNKGADFRAVLEEITEAEIPMPENNKWADAGMVEWDGGSLSWRVLDAQYWGVPQRRRRIFLVADFTGQSAGEILFEREGLRGDSSESGTTREEITRRAKGSIRAAGFKIGNSEAAHSIGYAVETSPTLSAMDSGNKPAVAVYGVGCDNGIAGTLDASYYKGQGERQGTERTAVAVYDMTHADEVMRPVEGGKCQTLNARMGTGGNQVPVLAFDTTQVTSPENYSHPKPGDPCHPLCANAHIPAIAFREGSFGQYEKTDVAGTTKAVGGVLGGGSETFISQKSVRRLTPLEAERLQGLEDGYTLIDDKTCSDTARYKALGNGMAQPCADYVIRRIVEVGT